MKISEIRHYLHQYPELSGFEANTAKFIVKTLREFQPNQLIENVGGYGVLAIYKGNLPGKNILLRADIDALQIKEKSNLPYRSQKAGIAHLCGHDGHSAILVEVARKLHLLKGNFTGKVILLFQPAEETGQGAKRVLTDPEFMKLKIDSVFGLHNLPGYKLGKIILRRQTFTSASQGVIINLQGTASHAGHPENGNNPVFAMLQVVKELNKISADFEKLEQRGLITIIHLRLGEIAFGTSPGDGVVMATFRTNRAEEMQQMVKLAENMIKRIAVNHALKYEINWVEKFAAIVNNDNCVDQIIAAADNLGYEIELAEKSFSWSEDFSIFTKAFPGGFFGIGAGENHPQLHNANYDFPDNLIEIGSEMFLEILKLTGQ